MNDASITELFWKRDEQAISQAQAQYGKLCSKIANNILKQAEDAEECVSSAYLKVWESIPPNRPDNLCAYICTIVKNLALKKLKYNSAEKRSVNLSVSLTELDECLPSSFNTESCVATEELSKAISDFLRTQNEQSRKIFVRRYWYTDSIDDIAELFGMKKKTVSTILFRTRKRLKQYLSKEGFINE